MVALLLTVTKSAPLSHMCGAGQQQLQEARQAAQDPLATKDAEYAASSVVWPH